nr:ATP synthase F0 subunit 8 [Tettigometridae sp.]
MPQMSPNSWLMILIMYLMNIMVTNSINFFEQKNKFKKPIKKSINFMNWKW